MKRIVVAIAIAAALTDRAALSGAVPGEARLAARADRAAACAVGRDRAAARELALAEPGSEPESIAYAALASTLRRCFEAQKIADTHEARALFAGAVARRLYVGMGRLSRSGGTRAVPTMAQLTAMVDTWNRERAQSPRPPGELQCAIGRAVEAADALVRSALGSAAERRAMPVMTAALAACIERGRQFRMSPLQFRAAIAREFYRYLDLPF
jgi:hypothetical protein